MSEQMDQRSGTRDRASDKFLLHLIGELFGGTTEAAEAAKEAEVLLSRAAVSALGRVFATEEEARILAKTRHWIHKLDAEAERLSDQILVLYERLLEDDLLRGVPEFTAEPAQTVERLEHVLTGVSRIVEDRLPVEMRRQRTAHLLVSWKEPDAWAVWRGQSNDSRVSLLLAARRTSQIEGGFGQAVSERLARRIVDELRAGKLALPGFEREIDQDETSSFRWLPPQVDVIEAPDESSKSGEPSGEVLSEDLRVWRDAPVLASLKDKIQCDLLRSVAHTMAGRFGPFHVVPDLAQARIFGEFVSKAEGQTQPMAEGGPQGSGIGLALVRRILDHSGLPREQAEGELLEISVAKLKKAIVDGAGDEALRSIGAIELLARHLSADRP